MTGKSVLFHRQYDRYSGGQQKVLDYFEHCLQHPQLDPYISWGQTSVKLETTPWQEYESRVRYTFIPDEYDLVFLAGMDWKDYLPAKNGEQTVINLIQHVRHADPNANVHQYLRQPAIRICVSEEVKQAIENTGLVNGKTFAIPNGIDATDLEQFDQQKIPNSVYILGLKQPGLAEQLKEKLAEGHHVICHTEHVERPEVLSAMATTEVSVLLPHATEGFFLPALESMRLSQLTIVPDCVGNRSFCEAGVNCLMPKLELTDLFDSVSEAFQLVQKGEAKMFSENARKTLEKHSVERERQAFYDLVESSSILK